MTLQFDPKTDEELNQLMEKGIYLFEVVVSEDYKSKTTEKKMIKLTLTVWDKNNRERILFDYLGSEAVFKIKQFCDATGLQEKYKTGELSAEDFLGKSGKCMIGIQVDKTGQYADRNSIKSYVKLEVNKVEEPALNDDIPF
jgi:hypothetical protein